MGENTVLPTDLARLAERETWFSGEHTARVLTWLESEGLPLLGIETARKLPDGKWMLLVDPMLLYSEGDDLSQSVQHGRRFIAEHSAPDLMFEPVWPGY